MPLKKITPDCPSHLENLLFHLCHLSSVKNGDMQNNRDTIIPQPPHETEYKSTRTRYSNLLLTEVLRLMRTKATTRTERGSTNQFLER